MPELTKWKIGNTKIGFEAPGLILLDGDMDRVVSIRKDEDGQIVFMEECDGYFRVTMSPEDAKSALREALAWLDE